MPAARAILFSSALYQAADGLRSAVAHAPDRVTAERLEAAEAMVRAVVRDFRLPSPEEPRLFMRSDP